MTRRALLAAGFAVLALAGCSGTASPDAETSPTSTSAAPETSAEPTSASPEPSTSAAAGCTATGDGTPSGASTAGVIDVDGDGLPDVAWLTSGADRHFGITTASGATFSAPIDSASPVPASAIVNRVGADGTPIALVDTGRSVGLFSLADCAVTATQNEQGEPYAFDKGFTGYGTGVGCPAVDGVLQLAGLDAVAAEDGTTFTVSRTWVELSDAGARAANGKTEVVAESAGPNDPAVTTAQETSCGDLVAGRDGPVEQE